MSLLFLRHMQILSGMSLLVFVMFLLVCSMVVAALRHGGASMWQRQEDRSELKEG